MIGKRDEELLADHVAGVAGAFDSLVARYATELYGFLQRFVGNAAAAEDLVQEAFLQVYASARDFDATRSFKPWLYTIAANKGRDLLRSRSRRQQYSLDSGGDAESPSVADSIAAESVDAAVDLDRADEQTRVRALIAQMPEHLRTMLLLGYYQQLPYAEIAEIVGIPIGTVKSRMHAAVTHFAKLWKSQGAGLTAFTDRDA